MIGIILYSILKLSSNYKYLTPIGDINRTFFSSNVLLVKEILKLILVIFCISWKLAIGSINDIYEAITRFLSIKLCKSDIIRW